MKDKTDIQKGFFEKSSKTASPRTEAEQKRLGKQAVKKLREIRDCIHAEGVDEEEMEKILQEYLEEDCGEGENV